MKYFIFVVFLVSSSYLLLAQSQSISILKGQVLSVDPITPNCFYDNTYVGGYKYFYSIQHFKIVTAKNDTLMLGFVYNILEDKLNFKKHFNIQKDSIYIFYVSEFTPCHSDFPNFCNCNYNNDKIYGQINPLKGSIVSKPYSKIKRIIYHSVLDKELWKQLKE